MYVYLWITSFTSLTVNRCIKDDLLCIKYMCIKQKLYLTWQIYVINYPNIWFLSVQYYVANW